MQPTLASVSECVTGLKDGVPLKGKPAELLVKIVTAAFPDVDDAEALVRESLEARSTRAKDYVAS